MACQAYDAVLFSNSREIGGTPAAKLVESATAEEPVVFIVNPDFTLGQFSVKANAYTSEPSADYLAKSVKNSNFHESQYFSHQIEATQAQWLSSADQYSAGSPIYIIYGEEWTSMEQLAEQLISKIDNSVGIITSTDAVAHEKSSRVKRVATDEFNSDSENSAAAEANGGFPFPLVIPPYNQTFYSVKPTNGHSCLFYLEGLTVVVEQKKEKVLYYANAYIPGSNFTWAYSETDVTCPNGTIGDFIFKIHLTLENDITGMQGTSKKAFTMKKGDKIDFDLTFTGDLFGYWALNKASASNLAISGYDPYKSASVDGSKVVNGSATQYTKLNSVAGWSLACGQSQAVFFPTNEQSVRIGVALMNTQIQLFNYQNPEKWVESAHFTLQTEDCTGTFSSGSWMGIVSALVLIAGLMFGYVMLQSVQTMDRFDDPKQRQIVINVRE